MTVRRSAAEGGNHVIDIRTTGDIIALSPPLIVEKGHIDFIIDTVGDVLKTVH